MGKRQSRPPADAVLQGRIFDERIKGFAVGEVQPPAARHEQLAPRTRHTIKNGDGETTLSQDIGSHQACWPRSDNNGTRLFRHYEDGDRC